MEHFALTNYLTVTKIFRFEMAHVLTHHDGLCKNIHGHSYELQVTITGDVKNEPGASDDGMILDFAVLKKLVQKNIMDTFDHALVLHDKASFADQVLQLPFDRIFTVPYQPTCENLIRHFAKLIVQDLPREVRLQHLRLYETQTSFADWYA